MPVTTRDLYIDLMKRTLSFTLWPEPPVPLEVLNAGRGPFRRFVISAIAGLLRSKNMQLVQQTSVSSEARTDGRIWPGYADTMIGLKRLDNLQFCVETAIQQGIEGDFIEAGVWRGGACIFMKAILAAHGIASRKVFVADSFEGLPPPDADQWPADRGDQHHTFRALAVSQDDVANNFRKYGLLDDQVVFLKGWFKDTLPGAPIRQLAVLRLDGDMYGSTMDTLVALYPKLSKGGFCIVDDYALPACKQAVDDYRAECNVTSPLIEIDWTGRYWRK